MFIVWNNYTPNALLNYWRPIYVYFYALLYKIYYKTIKVGHPYKTLIDATKYYLIVALLFVVVGFIINNRWAFKFSLHSNPAISVFVYHCGIVEYYLTNRICGLI